MFRIRPEEKPLSLESDPKMMRNLKRAGLAAGKFEIAHAAIDNAVAMIEVAKADVDDRIELLRQNNLESDVFVTMSLVAAWRALALHTDATRHVQRQAAQPVVPKRLPSHPKRQHFGMARGIVQPDRLVVRFGNHFARRGID